MGKTEQTRRELAQRELKNPVKVASLVRTLGQAAEVFSAVQVYGPINDLEVLCAAHPKLQAEIANRGTIERLGKFTELAGRLAGDMVRARAAIVAVHNGGLT